LQWICKECGDDQIKKYREDNPEVIRKHGAKYKMENSDKIKKRNRKYNNRNREERAKYSREYYAKNRKKALQYARDYRDENHKKICAQVIVREAIRLGDLPAATEKMCFVGLDNCNEYAQHWHHVDYSKPLDVFPVCRSCHKRLHAVEVI
jgi:hypothetical protein